MGGGAHYYYVPSGTGCHLAKGLAVANYDAMGLHHYPDHIVAVR